MSYFSYSPAACSFEIAQFHLSVRDSTRKIRKKDAEARLPNNGVYAMNNFAEGDTLCYYWGPIEFQAPKSNRGFYFKGRPKLNNGLTEGSGVEAFVDAHPSCVAAYINDWVSDEPQEDDNQKYERYNVKYVESDTFAFAKHIKVRSTFSKTNWTATVKGYHYRYLDCKIQISVVVPLDGSGPETCL